MKKTYKIAVIKGDGIGPEIIDEAVKVINATANKFNFDVAYKEYLMGGVAYDATGNPLPQETIDGVKASDACLFGAIGGKEGGSWNNLPREMRPESGLLRFRKELDVFANLRPANVYDALVDASSLKPEIVKGTDILVVRELVGGLYFGEPKGREGDKAFNTMVYTKDEVTRIAHIAFNQAMLRNKRVCSVDKANVLDVSQLWRETVEEVSKEYPEVELSHMYVDNCAMQLVRNPKQFDVILTGNIFGDILSDEASMLTGSIGMLASASVNGVGPGIYEPIHGSAPDIAGQGIANPIATIASAAMMLKDLGEAKAALDIEQSIESVLNTGFRTSDIANKDTKDAAKVGCSQMGDLIVRTIEEN